MAEYVELHARSAFSFLRGASQPEDLAREAARLDLPALALLDRDGVYGAARLYGSAREHGFRARVGAELTMDDGSIVPLLAATRTGYQNLCQLITEAKLQPRQPGLAPPGLAPGVAPSDRKRPCFATWSELARYSDGLIAFTGDEDGPVRRAWRTAGSTAAAAALEKLTAIFASPHESSADASHARLFVEIQRRCLRGEDREINFLRDLAAAQHLPLLATGGVTYATSQQRPTADVFTCLRLHTTLDAAGRQLETNSERHFKSALTMQSLFRDLPDAVANSARLEQRLEFTLQNLGYEFPTYTTPEGRPMSAFLHEVTFARARTRFGTVPAALTVQLERELALIAKLGFSGYFLIVWDICRWAREERGILVQGRGSAANSAVCYVLGITAVNPITHRLLF